MRLSTLLLAHVLLAQDATAAPCPETQYIVSGDSLTTSTAPTGSASWLDSNSSTEMGWNAPLGTIQIRGSSVGHHGAVGARVSTTDLFEILGAPVGTPVNVTFTLVVLVSSPTTPFSSGWAIGRLSDATGRSTEAYTNTYGLEVHVELPVELVPGVAQRITYSMEGGGAGDFVEVGVRLGIPDLPAGMSIVSCRGFQTGAVTAARATSWGRLKQIYR